MRIFDNFYSDLSFDIGKINGYKKGIEDAIYDTIYKWNKIKYYVEYPEILHLVYEEYESGYELGYYKGYIEIYGFKNELIDELKLLHNKQWILGKIIYDYKNDSLFDKNLIYKILDYSFNV